MGLFRKNPNEEAYSGGKKHWTDVIKNTESGDLLIWRQPEEDFNTNSTLIVMPGEEAIFIKNGTVEQVFENGTYKLTTENYPFISRLRNAFSGGISTFNCVVYFVRKAHSIEIRWGTDSPIQVRDKLLGVATKLRARGSYKVQIDNPVIFLEKLVGNNIFAYSQIELNKYFITEFQSKIKSIIARILNELDTELLGIDARLDEFSEIIQPYIHQMLFDYGLKCIKFSVVGIDIDDDELRRRYDEIGMDDIAKIKSAHSDKGVMDILGDRWGQQQAANILSDAVNNPNGAASIGSTVGIGMETSGVLERMAQQMFAPISNNYTQQSQKVNQVSHNRYVQKGADGTSSNSNSDKEDPVEILKKLKQMLDANLIEQEEYDSKKLEILSRM